MTNSLTTSIDTGIILSTSGAYQSPFTITSTGTVKPAGAGYVGVYGPAVIGGSLYLLNQGEIIGANGSIGSSGGPGGTGVELNSGNFTNSGSIDGGTGGTGISSFTPGGMGGKGGIGGSGVELNSGTFTNSGSIDGGSGGSGGFGGNGGQGGDGGNGRDGVDLRDGTLTNLGTIVGGNGGNGGFGGVGGSGNGGFGGSGVYLSVGTITNSGTIIGGTGGIGIFNGNGNAGVFLTGGTLIDSGMIAGGMNGGSNRADAVEFGNLGGTLVVEVGASFTGSVVANATIADVLAIGGSAPVTVSGLGSEYQNFHTLAFDTGATGTAIGTYTAFSPMTVTGFSVSDTLVLDGFDASTHTYVSGTGLELGNGNGSEITIDITGNFATKDFSVVASPGNTTISLNTNPCFAAGTRILTARGEIPVERMQEGTPVILEDGRIVPVIWLGHRTVDIARHPRPEAVLPVLIMAGALGDGVPARDLLLSPDHAIYLDGHLIPAKTLINGETIRQIPRRTITYYHVELAEHAIILAEGTPCESYLETGNRHAFENADASPIALHPVFGPATPDWQTIRQTGSCAPLAEHGPAVEAIRARLLFRADIATTPDPALTITRRSDGVVVIGSRGAVPGHLTADPRDRRQLGVKIAAITRADGTTIPLDHPDLVTGWHDPEPDGRWTDGYAVIPASLVGEGLPHVSVSATLPYRRTSTALAYLYHRRMP